MSAPGVRRWASSPVDTRSHLLPVDDGPRPIGCLVAVCGHVMPASAPTTCGRADSAAPVVCGTCEALSAVEVPAPQFPDDRIPQVARGDRAQPRLPVLISRRAEAALLEMSVHDGLGPAEALLRLVGYGQLVYEAARAGREIVLRGGGRPTERLRLIDELARHGLGPLANGSGPEWWRERSGRHEHG